jgi:sec-independent protein translocase protein TatA
MMLAEILGPDLLIVVIVIAVVLFGGAAIPKLARNLGSAKNEFEKGVKEGDKDKAGKTVVTDGPVTVNAEEVKVDESGSKGTS